MNFKKLLPLLLLVFVLAFAGCSSDDASKDDGASQDSASQDATSAFVEGTVIDATMNTVSILSDEQENMTFATEGAEIETAGDGIVIGDVVTIHYTGELAEGEEVQTATVDRIVVVKNMIDEALNDVTNTVSGKITDATMNSVTISAADGNQYTFMTDGAEVGGAAEGLEIGKDITISYIGELDATIGDAVQQVGVTKID